MPRQKAIVLSQEQYKISEASRTLRVPEKTLQGATTRNDMGRRGYPKKLLPKKDRQGVWHWSNVGLATWFNEMYQRRPQNIIAMLEN